MTITEFLEFTLPRVIKLDLKINAVGNVASDSKTRRKPGGLHAEKLNQARYTVRTLPLNFEVDSRFA
jgi:hypothetical protein